MGLSGTDLKLGQKLQKKTTKKTKKKTTKKQNSKKLEFWIFVLGSNLSEESSVFHYSKT